MSERLKRWERRDIPQITKAWVEQNCRHRITERDMALCSALSKRRLMRRDQIATLVPGFGGLANPEVQINRRLRALFDCHITATTHNRSLEDRCLIYSLWLT